MKVRITYMKAPWPEGAKVGDVVELDADAVPVWAVGKCELAEADADVTVVAEKAKAEKAKK